MSKSRVRSIASALVFSVVASTAGAADLMPAPSLWQAAQQAGKNAPLRPQTAAGPATGNPRTDGSFFKTRAGRLTLGLMVVGLGLTVYSINHDRKPVKSPVR